MSAQRHRSSTPAATAAAPCAAPAPGRGAATSRGDGAAAMATDTLAALLGGAHGAAPRGEADERGAAPPEGGLGSGGTSGAWGKEMGSYQGVKVYSNGPDSTTTHRGTYGLRYQCVEFVNRFSVEANGTGNMIGTGNAIDYAGDSRKKFGYSWVPNDGQQTLPSAGDILVFGGGKFGHVAIATGGDEGGVRMIQQNTSSATGTLSVENQGGSYKIKNWGRHNLLGWQTLGDGGGQAKPATPPAPAVTPTPPRPVAPPPAVRADAADLARAPSPTGPSFAPPPALRADAADRLRAPRPSVPSPRSAIAPAPSPAGPAPMCRPGPTAPGEMSLRGALQGPFPWSWLSLLNPFQPRPGQGPLPGPRAPTAPRPGALGGPLGRPGPRAHVGPAGPRPGPGAHTAPRPAAPATRPQQSRPGPQAQTAPAPKKPTTPKKPRTHTVVRGDTLWDISAAYLGDPTRYPEIARLNRIPNPDLIFPGTVLKLPAT